jgi:hypothetical protein
MNITYTKPQLKHTFKSLRKRNGNKRCYYVRAKGNDEYENYQVFQHKHHVFNQSVDIEEVNDYLEAAQKLKKEDKDDYFMSNGLDYDRCYEYINVVKYLNRCLIIASKSEKQDEKKWNFKVPGLGVLGILAFIYYFVKDDI